jgi:hypothetical protein
MAFTTWAALRTAIKDAIADHVAGDACTGSYSIGNRSLTYRSFEELVELLEKTYSLESLEGSGDRNQMTSFGRHRRF